MEPLDLRLVWALLAVAEEQSITRAAARLYVSQQTLSAQIQRLERVLGVELLSRSPRGVTLTAAGRELVAYGSGLSTELDELVVRLRAVAAAEEGTMLPA
ncbi:transcriptional regulator, LysR family [Catenulispora acidiphila DSM 44928]|uniref:Transcriptional regulator, LysR family n=1 Tax=Catenulispora acidiphila (strain DSM 44928 / JCM 14897 / NBRC 102108 / NRRL B-24433 / ID139908) TaxID=479433 RepID=C7PWI5_CATAD|nr:transcriptional regulator, LysR family [Catenulispora acidiphila DSM 44928]